MKGEKSTGAILCCTHSTELSRNRLCFRWRLNVLRVFVEKLGHCFQEFQYEFSLLTATETTLLPYTCYTKYPSYNHYSGDHCK